MGQADALIGAILVDADKLALLQTNLSTTLTTLEALNMEILELTSEDQLEEEVGRAEEYSEKIQRTLLQIRKALKPPVTPHEPPPAPASSPPDTPPPVDPPSDPPPVTPPLDSTPTQDPPGRTLHPPALDMSVPAVTVGNSPSLVSSLGTPSIGPPFGTRVSPQYTSTVPYPM